MYGEQGQGGPQHQEGGVEKSQGKAPGQAGQENRAGKRKKAPLATPSFAMLARSLREQRSGGDADLDEPDTEDP